MRYEQMKQYSSENRASLAKLRSSSGTLDRTSKCFSTLHTTSWVNSQKTQPNPLRQHRTVANPTESAAVRIHSALNAIYIGVLALTVFGNPRKYNRETARLYSTRICSLNNFTPEWDPSSIFLIYFSKIHLIWSPSSSHVTVSFHMKIMQSLSSASKLTWPFIVAV
jgi:hypothetical protein